MDSRIQSTYIKHFRITYYRLLNFRKLRFSVRDFVLKRRSRLADCRVSRQRWTCFTQFEKIFPKLSFITSLQFIRPILVFKCVLFLAESLFQKYRTFFSIMLGSIHKSFSHKIAKIDPLSLCSQNFRTASTFLLIYTDTLYFSKKSSVFYDKELGRPHLEILLSSCPQWTTSLLTQISNCC